MTMLTDRDISSRFYPDLVEPFHAEQVQPCSYDVRLDDHILRLSKDASGLRPYIDATNRTLVGLRYEQVDISESGYTLAPCEFILGSTQEVLHIPDNLAARYEGKSSMGRLGLASHITAGFIDPGFKGNLTLEVKNETPYPIKLEQGMLIGQLCFYILGGHVGRSYGDWKLGSHYQNQSGVTPAKG